MDETKEITLRSWEKTIDVQMHFNDIELQLRNYALTIFTAVTAGIGYLLKEKIDIIVMGYILPSSAAAAFIGMIIMCAFYFMDKYWYHVLLRGSVAHAITIENMLNQAALNLSSKIGESSNNVKLLGFKLNTDKRYYFFYYPLILIFLFLYLALLKWA